MMQQRNPETLAVSRLKGRAASPYRPGLFIKQLLLDNHDGMSASDMLKQYKASLPKGYHRPTYQGFHSLLRMLKVIGLIELVTDADGNPIEEPAKYEWLSPKRFWVITEAGMLEVSAWLDIRRSAYPRSK